MHLLNGLSLNFGEKLLNLKFFSYLFLLALLNLQEPFTEEWFVS